MDLLISANTVVQTQADKPPASGTPGWATDGNAAEGILATDFPAWHYNMMMSELLAFVTAAGITPDNTNWSQTLKAAQTLFAPAQRGVAPYNAALSTLIGGYPKFAIVVDSAGVFWVSMADANTTVPGASGATWQNLLAGMGVPWAVALTSTTLTPPSWAKSIELKMDGAGGGGSSCQGASLAADVSGSGGASGGHIWGVYPVASGQPVSLVIGSGGGSQAAGGTSSISIGGIVVASAGGGGAGSFQSAASSPGGIGGTATGGTILNMHGGPGSDGQCFGWASFGNGGNSRWGGAGRAGNGGGNDAAGYGSGGGGAYDARMTNTLYYGGAGKQGMAEFRWLPF